MDFEYCDGFDRWVLDEEQELGINGRKNGGQGLDGFV